MGDDKATDAEDEDRGKKDDVAEAPDPGHFGIDLGHRGNRAEQASRDAVDDPPDKKVKPASRTLTERLASAASERDDAASRKRQDKKKNDSEPGESTD
jgi:hypothetical protein